MEELDDGDGEHELREAVGAQHDRAHEKPRDRAGDRADADERQRLGDAVDAGDAGRIGAGAEERRLPERRDAAIADDEIERQDEQRQAR